MNSRTLSDLEARLDEGSSADPLEWLYTLDDACLTALQSEVVLRLRERPTPLGASGYEPLWRSLECIAGWIEYLRSGDGQRALMAERMLWLRGGDELRYLKRYALLDDPDAAYRLGCSLAATRPSRAAYLIPFLLGEPELTNSFFLFLKTLDHHTPLDTIRARLESVPDAVRPQATAFVLAALDAQPCKDRRQNFEVACLSGTTAEALALVRQGHVPAFVVASHAVSKDRVAQGHWFGLAAYAALVAGDDLGVVRYLRQANGHLPSEEQERIWNRASPSLRSILTQLGLNSAE